MPTHPAYHPAITMDNDVASLVANRELYDETEGGLVFSENGDWLRTGYGIDTGPYGSDGTPSTDSETIVTFKIKRIGTTWSNGQQFITGVWDASGYEAWRVMFYFDALCVDVWNSGESNYETFTLLASLDTLGTDELNVSVKFAVNDVLYNYCYWDGDEWINPGMGWQSATGRAPYPHEIFSTKDLIVGNQRDGEGWDDTKRLKHTLRYFGFLLRADLSSDFHLSYGRLYDKVGSLWGQDSTYASKWVSYKTATSRGTSDPWSTVVPFAGQHALHAVIQADPGLVFKWEWSDELDEDHVTPDTITLSVVVAYGDSTLPYGTNRGEYQVVWKIDGEESGTDETLVLTPNMVDGKVLIQAVVTAYGKSVTAEEKVVDITDGHDVEVLYSSQATVLPPETGWESYWHEEWDQETDLYMIMRVKGQDWSAPVLIKGQDGADGADGVKGSSIVIAYHTNALDNQPAPPAPYWKLVAGGDGSNGWTVSALNAKWIALKATAGTCEWKLSGTVLVPNEPEGTELLQWNADSWGGPIALKEVVTIGGTYHESQYLYPPGGGQDTTVRTWPSGATFDNTSGWLKSTSNSEYTQSALAIPVGAPAVPANSTPQTLYIVARVKWHRMKYAGDGTGYPMPSYPFCLILYYINGVTILGTQENRTTGLGWNSEELTLTLSVTRDTIVNGAPLGNRASWPPNGYVYINLYVKGKVDLPGGGGSNHNYTYIQLTALSMCYVAQDPLL